MRKDRRLLMFSAVRRGNARLTHLVVLCAAALSRCDSSTAPSPYPDVRGVWMIEGSLRGSLPSNCNYTAFWDVGVSFTQREGDLDGATRGGQVSTNTRSCGVGGGSGLPRDFPTVTVRGAKVSPGGTLAFEWTLDGETWRFSGMVGGDSMDGTVMSSRDRTGTWTGIRTK